MKLILNMFVRLIFIIVPVIKIFIFFYLIIKWIILVYKVYKKRILDGYKQLAMAYKKKKIEGTDKDEQPTLYRRQVEVLKRTINKRSNRNQKDKI